ncbi:putative zinc-binding metallopeptidase [Ancylomarina sp. 16SWW S1-10-2]|uniref:zinc-binding metallopeptidase n=1 Tax=Ancylomarina sp. 16SWW S1-10-2 TaxID=2499681 RepID=UPI00189D5236|nr:putative zinc-binding metallopeptidase [Ancylomarina sp. 16SWW S1-10-2]
MKLYKYIFLILLATTFVACDDEEDLGKSNIVIDDTKNEIDQWIYDNLTKTYNIEVKYEWDDTELENDKVLAAPALDKVLPFLKTLKKSWIEPYEIHGGETFIRTYIPKLLVLVGSRNMNDDGTMVQGTAVGGRKVVIYQLNEFDPEYQNSSKAFLKRMLHVMHHEFGHILHQTVMYPDEFKLVTAGGYTSAWMNVSETDALSEGFITPYSKLDVDENFVETIATILTNSKDQYDAILLRGSSAGQKLLRTKEEIVANYFQDVWHIDIYALQADIYKVIQEMDLEEVAGE